MNVNNFILNFFRNEAPSLVTSNDILQAPTPDFVISAYYFMCELIFNLENHPYIENEFCDPEIPRPLSGRPIAILRITNFLKPFFNNLYKGQNEFCMTDLLAPETKRTRFFLSNLIKFYMFKVDRQAEISKINDQLEARQRDVKDERVFVQNTDIKLEKSREQLQNLENQKKTIDAEESYIRKQLEDQKERKESIKFHFEQTAKLIQQREAKEEELKERIVELEKESERLDMNIVESPDELIANIEKYERDLKEENANLLNSIQELRKLERTLKDKDLNKRNLDSLCGDLKNLEKKQDLLSELKQTENQRSKSLGDVELRKKAILHELDEIDKNNAIEVRTWEVKKEESINKCKSYEMQKNYTEKETKELTSRLIAAKQRSRDMQSKISRGEQEFVQLENSFDTHLKKLETDHAVLKAKVSELKSNLSKDVGNLSSQYITKVPKK